MTRIGRRGFVTGVGAVGLAAGIPGMAAARDRGRGHPPHGGREFTVEETTVADIRRALDSGRLSCVELTQLFLARIAAYEEGGPRLNAITTVNPRVARQAAELDRVPRGRRGPLHGVPVLLKDNVDTADQPTSNGSVILKDAYPDDDAFLTRALRRQGALILGKASMGEFAGSPYSTLDGQMLNPYHLERQTGGSSAGSAGALAANLGVLAIGTDTSTSVRGPAAYCGIVGLRPTTGLISRDGIAPKNLTFDTAGPMARTVTDTALLFNAVAGEDPADPLSVATYRAYPRALRRQAAAGRLDYTRYLRRRSLRGTRLGVMRDFFGGDPEIDALTETALATLRDLGAELVDVTLDPAFVEYYIVDGGTNIRRIADYRFKEDWERYVTTLGPRVPRTVEEFVRVYETEVNQSPLPVADSVLNLLVNSLRTSTAAPEYADLMENVLPEATRLKLAVFDEHRLDAMVFPYESRFAPPIDNPVQTIDDPDYVRSDRPDPATFAGYSSVGFPGIVVPMGFGTQGLPMTLSFMGRPYSDGALLGYAYDYEQETTLRAPSPLTRPL